jgi:hypothetical protein
MSSTFTVFRFISSILAVLSAGLLAGIMLGTGMEQYTLRSLPEANWTLEHQTMDALFRRVMPAFFNVSDIADRSVDLSEGRRSLDVWHGHPPLPYQAESLLQFCPELPVCHSSQLARMSLASSPA